MSRLWCRRHGRTRSSPALIALLWRTKAIVAHQVDSFRITGIFAAVAFTGAYTTWFDCNRFSPTGRCCLSILFREYELLAKSNLFDAEYYRGKNPEIAESNID